MDFPVKNDYISVKDLVELQKICSTLFDNFNGGSTIYVKMTELKHDLNCPYLIAKDLSTNISNNGENR